LSISVCDFHPFSLSYFPIFKNSGHFNKVVKVAAVKAVVVAAEVKEAAAEAKEEAVVKLAVVKVAAVAAEVKEAVEANEEANEEAAEAKAAAPGVEVVVVAAEDATFDLSSVAVASFNFSFDFSAAAAAAVVVAAAAAAAAVVVVVVVVVD
jgi:hypothetical protein